MMTVNDVLDKVETINRFIDLYETNDIVTGHYGDMIELLTEYRDELLNKKIAK